MSKTVIVNSDKFDVIYTKPIMTTNIDKEESQDNIDNNNENVIDTKALNGLRGIAALHIAISNYAQYCKGYFQGNFSVSLFLCLSGYILTICYYNRDLSTKSSTWIFAKEFFTKRLAKLLPMYWISLIYFIVKPSQYSSHYDDGYDPPFNVSTSYAILTALSILCVNPWIGQRPWTDVGWTVSVLAFFYLCFPYLLKWLKTVKNRGQVFVYSYVSQILLCYIFYLAAVYVIAQAEYGSPLFTEGVLFGRGCPPGTMIIYHNILI